MAFLVLNGPRKSYSFGHDDLQHFPDSLLASYLHLANTPCPSTATAAAAAATEHRHGTELILSRPDDVAGSAVVMDLSMLPDSPLTDWPHAAAVAQSIYRHKYIAPEVLTAVLQGSDSNDVRSFIDPYEKLTDLLSYLNLPGFASQWLPPPETIALKHFNVLQFCCSSGVLDRDYQLKSRAREAVDLMLSYRPSARAATAASTSSTEYSWNSVGADSRKARFVLAHSSQKQANVPLRAYALDESTSWENLLQGRLRDCRLSEVLSGGNLGPPVSLLDANLRSETLVGSHNSSSQFTELLKIVFASITAGSGLCLTERCVSTYRSRDARRCSEQKGLAEIPVWIIKW